MTEKIVTINVQGMTCDGCATNVREALFSIKGVRDAKVKLQKKKTTVIFDSEQADEEMLNKAIRAEGYGVD